MPYLVSLPLVFQTTEEWLDSELGVHPVQVALQVRAVGRGAAGLAAAAGCVRACAPSRAAGRGLQGRQPPLVSARSRDLTPTPLHPPAAPPYPACQVALPELDGGIEPIVFAGRDSATGKSHSLPDRIDSLCSRAINWANLARKEKKEKKLAVRGRPPRRRRLPARLPAAPRPPPPPRPAPTPCFRRAPSTREPPPLLLSLHTPLLLTGSPPSPPRPTRAFDQAPTLQTAPPPPPAARAPQITVFSFPPDKGNVGTAAYLNVFGSIYRVLKDLQRDGYDVGMLPMSEEALIKSVLTQARARCSAPGAGPVGAAAGAAPRGPCRPRARRPAPRRAASRCPAPPPLRALPPSALAPRPPPPAARRRRPPASRRRRPSSTPPT